MLGNGKKEKLRSAEVVRILVSPRCFTISLQITAIEYCRRGVGFSYIDRPAFGFLNIAAALASACKGAENIFLKGFQGNGVPYD